MFSGNMSVSTYPLYPLLSWTQFNVVYSAIFYYCDINFASNQSLSYQLLTFDIFCYCKQFPICAFLWGHPRAINQLHPNLDSVNMMMWSGREEHWQPWWPFQPVWPLLLTLIYFIDDLEDFYDLYCWPRWPWSPSPQPWSPVGAPLPDNDVILCLKWEEGRALTTQTVASRSAAGALQARTGELWC